RARGRHPLREPYPGAAAAADRRRHRPAGLRVLRDRAVYRDRPGPAPGARLPGGARGGHGRRCAGRRGAGRAGHAADRRAGAGGPGAGRGRRRLPAAGPHVAARGAGRHGPAWPVHRLGQRRGDHPATASRALNPETRLLVREDTARRVLEAAEALGYHPNPVARSLRTRRSNTVGVLIPDLTNPLFPPIVRALEDRLAAAGYVALIGNTDGDNERERLVFQQMRARHVDGMVLATAHLSDPLLADAARGGRPVVLVNRRAAEHSLPSVSVDNERGMRIAVAHLAAEGHKKIAHIAGPQEVSTGLSRYQGFVS